MISSVVKSCLDDPARTKGASGNPSPRDRFKTTRPTITLGPARVPPVVPDVETLSQWPMRAIIVALVAMLVIGVALGVFFDWSAPYAR